MELELRSIYSYTNHYKIKSRGATGPHLHPNVQWLASGPSRSTTSSGKASKLLFQDPEEQRANPTH